MTNTYQIAGVRVRISSRFGLVHRLCADYLAQGEADISVDVGQADLAFERKRAAAQSEYDGSDPSGYSDPYIETLAVYRKIAEQLPLYDCVLMHGSCVAVDGSAYLFTAKSGTGKSTHTRLWRELLGERAVMVNDDKPILKVTDSGVIAYGTPWDGKHRLSSNVAVPLKSVCVLQRGETNVIKRISVRDAYPVLLQQIYRPADAAALAKTLTLIDKLTEKVGLFRLWCDISLDAARTSYDAMKG